MIQFSGCMALTILLILLLFVRYRRQLDQEFDQLVEANLTAYAESQRREVQASISDVEGTLDAIAVMLDTSDVDPESRWMTDYLETLSRREDKYEVVYVSMDDLREQLGAPGTIEDDYRTYELLMEGKHVVSEVRQSKRLGDRMFFSIAAPVEKDGRIVGVLRSLLKGAVLVQTLQTGSFSESVQSYVVKSSGEFVAVRDSQAGQSSNLFEELKRYGVREDLEKAVRAALQNDESATYRLESGEGTSFFLSVAGVGYNDWHIVNFTIAEDVTHHSKLIMRYTLETSIALILLTTAAGLVIRWLFRRRREELLLEQRRYAVLANFSDVALFEYSYGKRVLDFTSNAKQLLPLQKLHFEEVDFADFLPLIHPDDQKRVAEALKMLPDRAEIKSCELRVKNAADLYFWYECQYQALYDKRNQPVMLIGKLSDIMEKKEKERGLRKRSETDPLTGLYNRAAAESRIQRRLREPETAGFFLMIDIDNFKQVNDRNGHAVGDRLLARISATLRSAFRGEDVIGRVGGDEFVIFVATQDKNAVENRIRALLREIAGLQLEGGQDALVSCSVGAACFPRDGSDYGALFRAADHMMYLAKRSGKNTYRFSCEK